MKNLFLRTLVLISFLSFFSCNSSTDPSTWSSEKIDKWFEKGEWLNGWSVKPDASVNRKEFAINYFRNKERWDQAFTWLKETDLKNIEVKKQVIDGDNVFALVSEYLTKNEEDAKFEAHQKYIDIQYVVSGIELMSVAPVSMKNEILTPYDAEKDLEFMTVKESTGYEAAPDRFLLFFPSELHRPTVKVGENTQVKKVVVKVKID